MSRIRKRGSSCYLEAVTSGELRKLGVTVGHEGQALEVLVDGLVVEGAPFVGQVAESSGNAGSLA
jgi:hypothetical protein